jgi:hypothetical protein
MNPEMTRMMLRLALSRSAPVPGRSNAWQGGTIGTFQPAPGRGRCSARDGHTPESSWSVSRSNRNRHLPMNRGTSDCWNHRLTPRLATILPLPEGVAMTSGSPPGMINPYPCRPGALTRRCERVSASIILPPDGIFTVEGRGEGEREPVIHNHRPSALVQGRHARIFFRAFSPGLSRCGASDCGRSGGTGAGISYFRFLLLPCGYVKERSSGSPPSPRPPKLT